MFIGAQEIRKELPYWADYRSCLGQLQGEKFPDAATLNGLLPSKTRNMQGLPLRFVPASQLADVDYERHIFETGEVSTRENNWHDLFNALVWSRMPRLKAAMNARHYQEMQVESGLEKEGGKGRGKLRDALTLLDESGVIVAGSNSELLQSIVRRDWKEVFVNHKDTWCSQVQVFICGHALLEKFLAPYKAMTAHAIIVHCAEPFSLESIDKVSARALLAGSLFSSSASLTPLPLAGIPGWWVMDRQDQAFYDDRNVFRPAPQRTNPAPVHSLSDLSLPDDPGHMNFHPARPQ